LEEVSFSMKKFYSKILFFFFGLIVGFLIFEFNWNQNNLFLTGNVSLSQEALKEKKVKITAVGDVMLNRGVEFMVEKFGGNDWHFPFSKIKEDFEDSDIIFANLEGPLSDKGERAGSIYSFRFSPESMEALNYLGFNILSLANNHVFDYGREAFLDTLNRLEEAGISYLGAGRNREEAFSLRIKEVNGIKIGFLGYTNLGTSHWQAKSNSAGIAWINYYSLENVKNYIEDIRKEVDLLIISLHTGIEYSKVITDFQEKFSKGCIDSGADIVIGHHPHIIQKMERYKGGWIAYSLGNFVFDQGFSEETMEGLVLEITLTKKGENKSLEVIPKKVKINQFFQPEFNE